VAGDRWELEALGIGADGTQGVDGPNHWDGRLAAWLARVGDGWKTPAGRELVWRSRGQATPAMLCRLLADPATMAPESLALIRAIDFQDRVRVTAEVRRFVKEFAGDDEKRRTVLPELVMWLEPADAQDPDIATRLTDTARAVAGSQRFIDIVAKFGLADLLPEVVTLAANEQTPDQLAASAAGLAVDRAADRVKAAGMAGDSQGARLLAAVGMRATPACLELLEGMLSAADATDAVKAAAVRGLARSQAGGRALVELASSGSLTGSLPQVAAVAIAACPWGDVRQAAAGVLPLPKAKGGGEFPAVADLVKRSGNADRGRGVFAGTGTCAKCHIVGGEGQNVGPNLSGIGAKLSREGLYEAILAPSAAISHNYESYTAVLADGRSVTGLLVSKSPDAVVIRGSDGLDQSLAAGDVEELVRQPVSLMPADLATVLSPDDLVDLVSWLETLKQTN
jgi:putative heme-binding domain-containing protein